MRNTDLLNKNKLKNKIKDFRANNRDEFGEYRYYKRLDFYNGFDFPIRVVFDHEGSAMGADYLNPEKGELVRSASLISETEISAIVDQITKDEFYDLCDEILAHYR